MKKICVFCGSSRGARPEYCAVAKELGVQLVWRHIGLVYGGGKLGLMGQLADSVLSAGGEVVGVIPKHLLDWEVGHKGLTTLHVVASMHERKEMMADLADAFIALPGGFGTLEEFCEVLTWTQLGLHNKPCGLLNVEGFYSPLLEMFDRLVNERFLNAANRALVLTAGNPSQLLDAFDAWRPGKVRKQLEWEAR